MARLKRGHGKVIDLTHELAQELGLALDLGQTPGAGSTKNLEVSEFSSLFALHFQSF